VLATLATKLGDCLVLDVEAISVPADRKEARIAYYKHASELLSAAVATDERLRFELSRVLTKLAESFEAADRHTEAIESWSHALSQQQRLVQEVPESDIYRLELVSTLENQFRIAREQRNLAWEFEIATSLFSECQRLFQLDPDRYSREMRQAYLYLSHAHRDAGREEAMEWMEKACTEARRVSQLHSDSNDSRALADFLYQHALLLLEFVDKRSDTGRRIKALEKSIEHLNESTSIYDSLGESTTTELGSPFWSAIDFKHRIEDELEYLKKIHQESNRASNVFLNQEK
jgi:hypothetical protein